MRDSHSKLLTPYNQELEGSLSYSPVCPGMLGGLGDAFLTTYRTIVVACYSFCATEELRLARALLLVRTVVSRFTSARQLRY